MSSRGSPPWRLIAACGEAFARSRRRLAGDLRELRRRASSGSSRACGVAGLEHPVRVEDQRVAGASRALDVRPRGRGSRRAACPACRPASTFPFLRSTRGGGWPPSETVSWAVPRPLDGASSARSAAVQKRMSERSALIESWSTRSTELGACLRVGGGPDRVARQRGERRRLGPLAADVARSRRSSCRDPVRKTS